MKARTYVLLFSTNSTLLFQSCTAWLTSSATSLAVGRGAESPTIRRVLMEKKSFPSSVNPEA